MLRKEFVIVEDDPIGCEILRQIVESHADWKVVGVSHDGAAGIDMILKDRPDMVMLDLIMPQCDGFSVMRKVRDRQVDSRFFVVSGARDTAVMKSAIAAGASYFMTKPYDKAAIVERLEDILLAGEKRLPGSALFFSDYEQWTAAVDREIFDRFMAFALPVKQQGFRLLRYAVGLGLREPALLRSVTCKMYPALANKFRVSRGAVEHSMRVTLETAWDQGGPRSFADYIGNDAFLNVKPTTGEFLNLMAAKISLGFRYVGRDVRHAR